jgi:outer membrane protein TolC
MKKLPICLIQGCFGLCFSLGVVAQTQTAPSQQLAFKRDANGKIIPGKMLDIRERLVQLAMQNPAVEIDDRTVTIANYNLQNTKSAVLNNVVLQGNLNEYSIQGNPQFGYYPRYNIGVTFPLALFINRSRDINIGKENIGIATALKNQHYLDIKEAVLTRYEDYLMAVDLLNLQNQLVEDVYANFQKVEKNFADAKVQSADYATAYREYNMEQAKQRTLERNVRTTTLQLEKYIGIPLEDVLKEFK